MSIEILTGQINIDRFRVGARNDNKKGFTLAEVLITLGIIGVVAAITIPGLMTAHKAARMRSQFLKSYSTIQQVFRQMEADDISTDISSYQGQMGSFYNAFKVYLKGVQECGVYSNTKNEYPCLGSKIYYKNPYKLIKGQGGLGWGLFDDGQLVLPDGTWLAIENPNGGNHVWVFVDINGSTTPPNRLGYDLFTFEFINGELRTMGDIETTYNDLEKYCSLSSSDGMNGIACAHKAKIRTDYFKWVIKNVK